MAGPLTGSPPGGLKGSTALNAFLPRVKDLLFSTEYHLHAIKSTDEEHLFKSVKLFFASTFS